MQRRNWVILCLSRLLNIKLVHRISLMNSYCFCPSSSWHLVYFLLFIDFYLFLQFLFSLRHIFFYCCCSLHLQYVHVCFWSLSVISLLMYIIFLHVFVPFCVFSGAAVTATFPHWGSIKSILSLNLYKTDRQTELLKWRRLCWWKHNNVNAPPCIVLLLLHLVLSVNMFSFWAEPISDFLRGWIVNQKDRSPAETLLMFPHTAAANGETMWCHCVV